jgi:hypothetical protein
VGTMVAMIAAMSNLHHAIPVKATAVVADMTTVVTMATLAHKLGANLGRYTRDLSCSDR